ncbi:hypothetical protein [Microbispora bryophytorum]|uniref:hypothetical protein n=1 Tax=Microbispora bryophytorum TaxID=1460882 RepID=UPI00371BAAD1
MFRRRPGHRAAGPPEPGGVDTPEPEGMLTMSVVCGVARSAPGGPARRVESVTRTVTP